MPIIDEKTDNGIKIAAYILSILVPEIAANIIAERTVVEEKTFDHLMPFINLKIANFFNFSSAIALFSINFASTVL